MKLRPLRGAAGFTLVELLTVVAIIMLLVGILIPALSAARTQAKNAAASGMISSIERGCEMFHADFKKYPVSRGVNPFEDDGSTLLTGAQWLALQLVGPDGVGFIDPSIENDSDGDGEITGADWINWYDRNFARKFTRQSLYAEIDGASLMSPDQIADSDAGLAQDRPTELAQGDGGSTVWNNGRLPMFIDPFGYPILYYRATQQVKAPFTTGTAGAGSFVVGRYDQADNAYLTGSDGNQGRWPAAADGWDFAGGGKQFNGWIHPLGNFGYDPSDPFVWPPPKTFANFMADESVFERTADASNHGTIQPHKPDTFVLIAAGEDGLYGSSKDITNFGGK